MNFNKLGIAVLSAGAIFMATSCNDGTVSRKKACEWVESHFTHKNTEETNLKQLKVNMDATGTKGEDAIGNLNYIADMYGIKNFDTKTLKGDAAYTKDKIPADCIYLQWRKYYVASDDFVGMHSEETVKTKNTKFLLKNNVLTESSSYDAKISGAYSEGKMKEKNKYSKEGAWLYASMKVENGTVMSFDGVVNVSVVITVEY